MIKRFKIWKLKREQARLWTRLDRLKAALKSEQITYEMYWIGLDSISAENKEIRSKILKLL